MKDLPDKVTALRSTPVFTEETIPAGLLKDHATKEGTWGVIQIESGQLKYTIGEDEVHILTPDKFGTIEPTVKHHVRAIGEVVFKVEFYT